MNKKKIIVAIVCVVLSFMSYSYFQREATSAGINAAVQTRAADGLSDLSDLSYHLGIKSRSSYRKDQRSARESYGKADEYRTKETTYNILSYVIPAILIILGYFYLLPPKKKVNE